MKIAKVACLALTIRVTASITYRDVSLAADQVINVRDDLATREPQAVPETAKDIWAHLIGDTSCLGCQGILQSLKTLANVGDDTFVGALQALCSATSSQDRYVCDGTLALAGPDIAASLRDLSLGSKTAQILCTTLLGLCSYPEVEPYTVPMPLQSAATTIQSSSSVHGTQRSPLKIAHFSDIHIDPLYVTGSNANCSKPIRRRPHAPADAPGNNDFPAGPFGDHNCGAPLSLEQSMYDAINAFSPDFALFTGDIVDHAVWNTTVEQNYTRLKWMVRSSYSRIYQLWVALE